MKKLKPIAKLPAEIPIGDGVKVFRIPQSKRPKRKDGKKILGYWNPVKGEICIVDGQHPVHEIIILVHEALHMAETVLKKRKIIKQRMPEKFIESAAAGVTMALLSTGVLGNRFTFEEAFKWKKKERKSQSRDR